MCKGKSETAIRSSNKGQVVAHCEQNTTACLDLLHRLVASTTLSLPWGGEAFH